MKIGRRLIPWKPLFMIEIRNQMSLSKSTRRLAKLNLIDWLLNSAWKIMMNRL